jgi:SET domain-containing protein 6
MSVDTQAFESWMRSKSIVVDGGVSINTDAVKGYGLVASRELSPGHVIASIPKRELICVKNSAIAGQLKKAGLADTLGTAVALLYELSLKDQVCPQHPMQALVLTCLVSAQSRWYGYLKLLPRRATVPMFWTQTELHELKGTELCGTSAEDRKMLLGDWTDRVLPLVAAQPKLCPKQYFNEEVNARCSVPAVTQRSDPTPDWQMFCDAVSVVASRAFWVDEAHGEALVPFAVSPLYPEHFQHAHGNPSCPGHFEHAQR